MKAIFKYSDGSIREYSFLSPPENAKFYLGTNCPSPVLPVLVYFEGQLTPQEEKSKTICAVLKEWQIRCLKVVTI